MILAEALSDTSTITIGLGVTVCAGIIYMSVMLTSMKRDIHDLKRNLEKSLTRDEFSSWAVRTAAANRGVNVPDPRSLGEFIAFGHAEGVRHEA